MSFDNPQPDKKRVTLRDVAHEAGVSLKTASNVINHNGRMASSTRARVQEVIERLGYQVNAAARTLNVGTTGFVTLAVPMLAAPYMADLADHIIRAARERGYSVYITTYQEDGGEYDAAALLKAFNTTVSDGLILSMTELDRFTPDMLDVHYPLMCLGARTTWEVADRVATDDEADAATAVAHMFERGMTSLAVVGAHRTPDLAQLREAVEGNAEMRLKGAIRECERRGKPLDPELIGVTGYDWSIGNSQRTMQRLIDSGKPFDGVLAMNDQVAIGVMNALAVAGIAIPDEVQVVGFDNNEESAYLLPSLTTMDSRLDWISAQAVDLLLARINGKAGQPHTYLADSRLITRKSTR
ncbi:LacI family DNA-binding transcriptional regulator [Bifidobacterium oedipodis]|uniref:LacI family transcriptional regulator n=1 Tax=Bifidobacterium oedipodis TaxID=2675322 RepID=A0A7Y0HRJ7_9BIFI|nr:LacI family transcriptional regulator [Bifidobacterium sp. DSM 109957]